jgi:multidrug transporter EmrE-like cation transporter
MNGMVNLFVMLLSGKMALSLMFPLISSGGIIITFFVSTLFYKEKFTKAQLIGFIAGVASVVFLNI